LSTPPETKRKDERGKRADADHGEIAEERKNFADDRERPRRSDVGRTRSRTASAAPVSARIALVVKPITERSRSGGLSGIGTAKNEVSAKVPTENASSLTWRRLGAVASAGAALVASGGV
jgi:hypothetical protein